MEATQHEEPVRDAGFDPGELRSALEATLTELDSDESATPRLRATGIHLCLELTDLGERVELGPAPDAGSIEWRFLDPEEQPRPGALGLEMSAEVANRWLLGLESLPVAIARGRIRASGGSSSALAALPAMRLIVDSYRHLVETRFPGLAIARPGS